MVGFNSKHHLYLHHPCWFNSNQSIYENLLNLSFATVSLLPALFIKISWTDHFRRFTIVIFAAVFHSKWPVFVLLAEWRTLIGRDKLRYCALIGWDHSVDQLSLASKTQLKTPKTQVTLCESLSSSAPLWSERPESWAGVSGRMKELTDIEINQQNTQENLKRHF